MQCGIVCDECKCLSVRGLRICAENRVFRSNISVVEKKCVVLAIDCCLFSVCFKPESLVLFLFRSARLPSLVLPSGSFRSLAFRFQFSRFPFPVLSCAISHSLIFHSLLFRQFRPFPPSSLGASFLWPRHLSVSLLPSLPWGGS